MEASAVVPEGRISPEDLGIWSDDHIPGLKRIVDFVHAQGTVIGIQIAHSGRKGSIKATWVSIDLHGVSRGDAVATKDEGGWPDEGIVWETISHFPVILKETIPHPSPFMPVYGPSEISYAPGFAVPKAMTSEQINQLEEAYAAAVKRAGAAGCKFLVFLVVLGLSKIERTL